MLFSQFGVELKTAQKALQARVEAQIHDNVPHEYQETVRTRTFDDINIIFTGIRENLVRLEESVLSTVGRR